MRGPKVPFNFIIIGCAMLVTHINGTPQGDTDNTIMRHFNCEGDNRSPPLTTHTLVICGPPREGFNPYTITENGKIPDDIHKFIVCNCKLERDTDLNILKNLNELREIYMNDLEMKVFDFTSVTDLVRLRTINLDNNPLNELRGDAQITLEHLSLQNTSLTNLPDNKEIMKQIISLNITSDRFTPTHEEVCATYATLEFFNGLMCERSESHPKVEDNPPKQTETRAGTSLGNSLTSTGMGLTLLASIFTFGRHSSWTAMLIVLAHLQLGTVQSASLYNPNQMANETDLHLESRGISALDYAEFAAIPQLTHLYLNDNSLTHLDFNAPKVIYLDLSNNLVQSIQDEDFELVPSLKVILLAGNELKAIDWNFDGHEMCNISMIDLSRNSQLQTVYIKSEKLTFLSLAGTNIDELYLETPKLRTLEFIDANYTDGGPAGICRNNPHMTFVIIYRNQNGTVDRYECSVDTSRHAALSLTKKQSQEVPTKKVVGCEFSTLRIKVDDVVLSKDQYFWLNVVFAAMGGCVLILCALLLWLLRLLYQDASKEWKWAPRRTDEFWEGTKQCAALSASARSYLKEQYPSGPSS